tara:strand:+ start:61 stop:504 length:444 start_codon:yes stop_codon:yes gene_type:complete
MGWYSTTSPPTRGGVMKKDWKKYYAKYKHKILEYNKTPFRIASSAMNRCKRRSKAINVDFNLTNEYLQNILPKDMICPIFNKKMILNQNKGKVDKFSLTIDRIDPNKGYIKGNVRWLSWLANSMLNCANKEELIQFSKYLNNIKGEI